MISFNVMQMQLELKPPEKRSQIEQNARRDLNYSRFQKAVVAIACLGFFPLLYLLGRTIVVWLGH